MISAAERASSDQSELQPHSLDPPFLVGSRAKMARLIVHPSCCPEQRLHIASTMKHFRNSGGASSRRFAFRFTLSQTTWLPGPCACSADQFDSKVHCLCTWSSSSSSGRLCCRAVSLL